MIYHIFKPLFKLTQSSYFNKVQIQGKENIPADKPIIFVANHPSAFMDPIIVATVVPQTLHFIAAGEFFGKGLKAKFFKNQLNMIPVYRPNTMPGQTHKNDQMFKACYDHLGDQGSLLIFPEGNSITEKRLRDIKTGVARIGLGAEKQSHGKADIHVIPIGLNYDNPHEFQSNLFVKIGTPIRIQEYLGQGEEREMVQEITKNISQELRDCVLHTKEENTEKLIDKIEKVYANELKLSLDLVDHHPAEEYKFQKDMIEVVEYYKDHKPKIAKKMEARIDQYMESSQQLSIESDQLKGSDSGQKSGSSGVSKYLKLILGLPVLIIGVLLNFIPYQSTKTVMNNIKVEESFKGSFIMVIGMALFVIWYLLGAGVIYLLTQSYWLPICFPFVAYFSGLGALQSMNLLGSIRKNKSRKQEEASYGNLLSERKSIIDELEKYRLEFLELA